MTENRTSLAHDIENTMACTAFAEAGEPCPIDGDVSETAGKEQTMSVADTMACSAYAEAGEECPIGEKKAEN